MTPSILTVNPYRLAELRDKAGIKNDAELAKRLGVDASTLSRYKRGQRVSGDFIANASTVFGLSIKELAGDLIEKTPRHAEATELAA